MADVTGRSVSLGRRELAEEAMAESTGRAEPTGEAELTGEAEATGEAELTG
jgi:hypothetical protein